LPNNEYTFPFSQPVTQNYGQMRVDQNFSANDTLFVRYTGDGGEQIQPLAFPQFTRSDVSRAQFATLSESHVFSPTVLNTARFSFSRTHLRGALHSEITNPQFALVPDAMFGTISISGVTPFGTGNTGPSYFIQNLFTWSDDVFYSRGRHSLKFGTLINRYRQPTQGGLGVRGSVGFANLTAFLLAQPNTYTAASPGSISYRNYEHSTFGFYVQDDLRVKSNLTLNLGLRYEFTTQFQEVNGRQAALRDIQHDAETTLGPAFKNPSLKNISPRFGFAWDVAGDGKTAVRGGFGLLYDVGIFAQVLLNGATRTPPFASQSSLRSTAANPLSFTVPFVIPPEAVGKTIGVPDYLIQQPHMLHYNLAVERELPGSMAITLAYGGSRGINLNQFKEGNPTVPQIQSDGRQFWAGNEPRTNPNWDSMGAFGTAAGNSWYNSLQFSLNKRLTGGLQFQSSFTWAKTMDETQGQGGSDGGLGGTSQQSDPTHREVDRGLANFDSDLNWKFNAIYRLPEFPFSSGVVAKVLNGWWMSGILSVQGGVPFTPALTVNRSRSGVNAGASGIDRPDLVVGRNNDNIILGGPERYYDPSAFTVPAAGFLGTAGRNILRGPGEATLDFSVVKDTALGFLGESGRLEFRAEFFNLLNRVNFSQPDRIVFAARANVEAPLATAGRINSTVGTSRQVQLALKILF